MSPVGVATCAEARPQDPKIVADEPLLLLGRNQCQPWVLIFKVLRKPRARRIIEARCDEAGKVVECVLVLGTAGGLREGKCLTIASCQHDVTLLQLSDDLTGVAQELRKSGSAGCDHLPIVLK